MSAAATTEASEPSASDGDQTGDELSSSGNDITIPLGLPPLPDAVLGYELDRSSDSNLNYSGSFNTNMEMDDALGFYVDAITKKGGAVTHDGRGDPGEFRSIQGTLAGGATFYISVADVRDDKGYVQLDIKLKEQ